MKIALLVRGFHYLERDRFGYPLDARQLLPSLLQQVAGPLRQEHAVTIFAATYPSPIQEETMALLRPDHLLLLESASSSQIATFRRGLRAIQAAGAAPFDRVIATRFDLLYLQPITAWNVWERRGIFFPWREYEHFWKEHHRVGDAIHVIDADSLPVFEAGLAELEGRPDLHFLYAQLETRGLPLHFLEEGFYDSNTLFGNRECVNPLYRIGNRPRLWFHRPVASPWMRQLKSKVPPQLWRAITRVAARVLRRDSPQ